MLELALPRLTFSISSKTMVSTNDMYFHVAYKKKNTGRLSTHAVKTSELSKMQENFIPSLHIMIDKEFVHNCIKYLKTDLYGLSISTSYYMPLSNYRGSDVSNYIKAYEDCISYALKEYDKVLDDKNNLEYLSYKYCNNGDLWRMITTIELIPRDSYYRSYVVGRDMILIDPKIDGICPICQQSLLRKSQYSDNIVCNKCHAIFIEKEGDN